MRDNDSKSLEALYESVKLINEDESGRPMASYGSNAASVPVAPMGTEPLVQTEVEVPAESEDERESDDEEQG